jgi:hypothetical protein
MAARGQQGHWSPNGHQDVLNEIMPGDIFYFGPDQWSIHHTVLARSRMVPAHPDIVELLEGPPGAETFACHTIESTRALSGEVTPWYPALSFFQRVDGVTSLVADSPPDSGTLQVVEAPVPVKVLMHPLRDGRFHKHLFNEAVVWGASTASRYGKRAAVKAFLSQALHGGSPMVIDPGDFPTPESRSALFEDLRGRWDEKPICASVCVKVWQMYFELLGREAGRPDEALAQILRWMPVYSNRITPSALLKVLTARGWELRQL